MDDGKRVLRNARPYMTSSGRPQMERWLRFAVGETRAALFVSF